MLHVAHSSSCGPDDGHQLTETCCPIEFIQDPYNRDLAFVAFDGILNKLSLIHQHNHTSQQSQTLI